MRYPDSTSRFVHRFSSRAAVTYTEGVCHR